MASSSGTTTGKASVLPTLKASSGRGGSISSSSKSMKLAKVMGAFPVSVEVFKELTFFSFSGGKFLLHSPCEWQSAKQIFLQ